MVSGEDLRKGQLEFLRGCHDPAFALRVRTQKFVKQGMTWEHLNSEVKSGLRKHVHW